jgi:hypothetical protein
MGKVSGNIGKALGNVLLYFSVVFHPRRSVKMALDYREGAKMLQDTLDSLEKANHLLQTRYRI